jgi:putative ABC transport system permease protein
MAGRGLVERVLSAIVGAEEAASIVTDLEEIRAHRRRTQGAVRAEIGYRLECVLYPARVLLARLRTGPSGSMRGVLEDAGYALRSLRRNGSFVVLTVSILAVCLGGTASVASLVKTVLLDPLPYAEPDRVVALWARSETDGRRRRVSPGAYTDLEGWRGPLESAGAFAGARTTITTGDGEPETLFGSSVTPSYFTVLGARPLYGRTFTRDDAAPGAAPVVILGQAVWRSRFGGDASVVGDLVTLDGASYRVVGVMPAGVYPVSATIAGTISFAQDEQDFWVPLTYPPALWSNRRPHLLGVVARLADGVSMERAEAAMAALSSSVREAADRSPEVLVASPISDEVVGDVRGALTVLLLAAVLLLMIATTNVASLAIVRTDSRRREFAVRIALGAGRARVVRQMLLESSALGLAGAVAALPVAWLVLREIRALVPFHVPRLADVGVDATIMGLTMFAGMCSAIAFGAAPAFRAGRHGSTMALGRAGSGLTAGSERRRIHQWTVGLQAALVVIVTVFAALLVRSYRALTRVDPGFANMETLVVPLRAPDDVMAQVRDLAAALPNVRSATLAYDHPLQRTWGDGLVLPAGLDPVGADHAEASVRPVGVDYFETVGVRLIEGRVFTDADRPGSAAVAIVNRALAERYFPGGSALGRTLGLPSGPRIYGENVPAEWEVVGIVQDERFLGPRSSLEPAIYLPLPQLPAGGQLLVRPAGNALTVMAELRALVRDIDPTIAFPYVRSIGEELDDQLARPRFNTLLLGAFAVLGLILCALGIYGLAGRTVTARTSEIGIRAALGAGPVHTLSVVLRGTLVPVMLGTAFGTAVALSTAGVLRTLLFGVSPHDATVFLLTPIVVLTMTLTGTLIPSIRALAVSPVRALRSE